jgi:hypothetical protein
MKIITLILFVLLAGVFITTFVLLADNLNSNYGSEGTQINKTKWADSYNYSYRINESVEPLRERFVKIADPDVGFYTKIGSGIVAIYYAVILFPSLALSTLGIFDDIITSLGANLHIPPYIIYTAIVALLVFVIGKLLGFLQKSE